MIYFRADGNRKIGSGHVMRCKAIAHSLRNLGQECVFIAADNSMQDQVLADKFKYICLNSKWQNLELEIEKLTAIINKNEPQAMVLDSYFVNEKYIKGLSQNTRVIYIDDYKNCFASCSMVINYSFYCNKEAYTSLYEAKNAKTKLLLGQQYTPLRAEFKCKRRVTEVKQVPEKILITTGGADEFNIAGTIVRLICTKFPQVQVILVAGSLNANLAKLKMLEENNTNLDLEITPPNIAELMQKSDIAISAGGTTLYELCACGVPTICFSLADNQKEGVKWLHEHGFMISIGDARDSVEEFFNRLSLAFNKLFNSYELRQQYKQRLTNLVDGLGSERIAKEIIKMIGSKV